MTNTVHIVITKHKINQIKDIPTEGSVIELATQSVALCFEYVPIEWTVTILNNQTLERINQTFTSYDEAAAFAKPYQPVFED